MPGYPYAADPYAANPYGMYPGRYSPYGGYAGMGYGGYSLYGTYAPVAPTSQAEVAIYDNYFEPRTVYLTPGGTVHWTNLGRHLHTVTDYAGNWGSGEIRPGDSYTFTPPVALNHYFYCRHHPLEMNGSIVVRPPQPGPPQGAGGYTNPGY
jgi:plastocyanin